MSHIFALWRDGFCECLAFSRSGALDFASVSHFRALAGWIVRVSRIFALWRDGLLECLTFSRSGAVDFASVRIFALFRAGFCECLAFSRSLAMDFASVSHFRALARWMLRVSRVFALWRNKF